MHAEDIHIKPCTIKLEKLQVTNDDIIHISNEHESFSPQDQDKNFQDLEDTSQRRTLVIERPHRVRKKNQKYAHDFIEEVHVLGKNKKVKLNEKDLLDQSNENEELHCTLCDEVFHSTYKFKKHIKTIHSYANQNCETSLDKRVENDVDANTIYIEGQSLECGQGEDGTGFIGAHNMPSNMFGVAWEAQVVKEEIILDTGMDEGTEGVEETGSRHVEIGKWKPRLTKMASALICETCGALFERRAALDRHVKRAHSTASLDAHSQGGFEGGGKSKSKRSYRCHLCISASIKRALLESGDTTETLDSSSVIDTTATYPSKTALTEHVKSAHPGCSASGKTKWPRQSEGNFEMYRDAGDLQRRHTMGYQPGLGSSYLKSENLEDVLALEQLGSRDEPQYICGSCDGRFQSKSTLVTHVETVHEGNPSSTISTSSPNANVPSGGSASGSSFACPFCDRVFAKTFHLNRHLASDVHSDLLAWRCNSCGLRFPDREGLDQHLIDFFYHADPGLVKAPKYICYLCTYPTLHSHHQRRDVVNQGGGVKEGIDILASAASVGQEQDILALIDPGPDGTRNAVSAIQRLLDPQTKEEEEYSSAPRGDANTPQNYLNQMVVSSSSLPHTSPPSTSAGPPIKIVKFNKREEYIRHLKKIHPDHYFATFGQPLNNTTLLAPPGSWNGLGFEQLMMPNTASPAGGHPSTSSDQQLFQQYGAGLVKAEEEEEEDLEHKYMGAAAAAASYTIDNNLVITIGNNVTSVFQVTALPQTGVKVKRRTRHDLGEDVGYSCQYCGKCLAYDRSLKQHIKTMHREEWNASAAQRIHAHSSNHTPGIVIRRSRLDLAFDPGHLCEYCGKTLAYARSLREHIKTVHRNEPGYLFTSQSAGGVDEHEVGEDVLAYGSDRKHLPLYIVENGGTHDYPPTNAQPPNDSGVVGWSGEDRHDSSTTPGWSGGRVKRRSRFDLRTPGFLCNFCGKTLAYDRSLKYHIKSVHWRETAAILEGKRLDQLSKNNSLLVP